MLNKLLTTLIVCGIAHVAVASDLYVDYSERPDPARLLAYDVCILSPEAEVDLSPGKERGNRYYGYLSLVEIAVDASYGAEVAVPILAENSEWESKLVDITDKRWEAFVVRKLGAEIVAAGFDGIFLDTVDSYRALAAKYPERAGEFSRSVVGLVKALKAAYPEQSIILNRGFDLMPELVGEVDGILTESVFQTVDLKTNQFAEVDAETSDALLMRIREAKSLGFEVYAIDYVAPEDRETAQKAAAKLREVGVVPFITTPDLQGGISGAVGAVARKILVLFGHDPVESETYRIWPADTTATSILQTAAEWMGYEFIYHDVGTGLPVDGLGEGSDYVGVILDEEMTIPYRFEGAYADWLVARVEEEKKVLFLGSYGFADHSARRRIFEKLGIRGSDGEAPQEGEAEILLADEEIFNFETTAKPRRHDFQDLQAPEGARVLMSVGIGRAQYDTSYLANWGGALMSPYVTFEASEETVLSYADPFKLLEEVWPAGNFPAPDPTTRDGLRVFYTHIDGDGFSSISQVHPGRTCAEVLHDRVLKDLPWPVTVSVVEAELRGETITQKRGEREWLEPIARKIFALPHVEPASHSYSHPYIWLDDDAQYMGLYDQRNMELKLTAKYPAIDVQREIEGSINYITNELTPDGKPVKMMLWSGNCRPSPQALRVCEENGWLNMNGGNTILSRRFRGIAAVAPRVISWDGHLQIYASNQNEFMYTDGWMGPYFGGFGDVTETFEMTESPRRLKPVNVYYHFYSAERHDSLLALEKVYAWCAEEELRPMRASEFALLTRDSHLTEIVEVGPQRWVVMNEGYLRTFRLPVSAGVPDVGASEGVTGYRMQGDSLYIHTDGSRRVSIQLAEAPLRHPRLVSSDADVHYEVVDDDEILLRAGDRPATVRLGGFLPHGKVLKKGGGEYLANGVGIFKVQLSANEEVQLKR